MKRFRINVLVSFLFCFGLLYSQKQNNQWRYGGSGAIDFNTVPPSFVTGAALNTPEGSASIADKTTGALLFYTDGVTVWNANNQVMPNGTGLLGGVAPGPNTDSLSSTTAAVIVPKPGSATLFYIVTIDQQSSNNGVRYSVIDMTLNGGLGDVVAGQKNILLLNTNSEKLEVVPTNDIESYWLLTRDNSGDSFYSFRITGAGIQSIPVISTVGSSQGNGAGHMKINKQFNKLAIGVTFASRMELFDFDNSTGVVSNPITWNYNLLSPLIYGIEFSPDGKVLYISDLYTILQYDLTQTTPQAIQNSAYQVASGNNASLQLGIDEKIYVNSGSLSAINCPNELGANCGYQTNVIANQTGGGGWGLPKWVYYADDEPISTYNAIIFNENCFPGPVEFFIADTTGISNITWNFGDPNSGINNTAVGDTVYHNFSQLGVFNVQATFTNACGFLDTLSTGVAILNPCNPPNEQCDVFQYTGAVQQWTVPPGIDTIRVKMWGAAGGGGPYLTDAGGGGGFTEFELAVTPGESLEISVGQGGKAALGGTGGAGGWPGGGGGGSGNLPAIISGVSFIIGGGGGGGGATIIRRLTNNTLIAVAGAGGGSAFGRNGGGGGGLEGQFTALTNEFNQYGFGGTQSAGGAPAQNTFVPNSVLGTAGSAFLGGVGATDLNPDNQRKGGGGGGSGYYGGGGGSAYDGSGLGVGSSGGGGSGFLLCTNCPNLSGSLLGADPYVETPANPTDPLLTDYPGTAIGNPGGDGGNGIIQICYSIPACSPTFNPIPAFCAGDAAPVLPSTSLNGIVGTWSPATVSNTTGGTYTFTPNAGQCAIVTPFTITITVNPLVTPTFNSIPAFCTGDTAPVLPTTSLNGIVGTWSPATVSNTTTGTYTFTPNAVAGQCYSNKIINITVLQQSVPDFEDLILCENQVGYVLSNQSPNGIIGTWSPATINFTTGGNYTFTPNSGQCASTQTILVTINSSSLTDFQWIVSEPFSDNPTITIIPNSPGNYLYQLDFGPQQTSNVFQNVSSGFHTVQVVDINGCSNTIKKEDILIIDYPKFFTPNDDGYNDTWNINDLFLQNDSKIYIYDRYGKLLKQIFPSQSGWDGKYNNSEMFSDDYWFVVEFEYNNTMKLFKAHFALKR